MAESGPEAKHRRTVRSYVLRQGRLTDAQRKALADLWPKYGIDPGRSVLNPAAVFGRTAPLVVEVGFGNGAATWRMAKAEQDTDFIGIEVHRPGVGRLLRKLESEGISNVRIACTDAVEFIEERLPDGCLAGVRIWFPDPWPKKRHHKRRLFSHAAVEQMERVLAEGGFLHVSTDVSGYFEQILEVVSARGSLLPAVDPLFPVPAAPGQTHYEAKYVLAGRVIHRAAWQRISRSGR
jgi:tRNA (guanine-N7-)-methyltransferase